MAQQWDEQSIRRIARSVLNTEAWLRNTPRLHRRRSMPASAGVTIVLADINEGSGVATSDATYDVDGITVLTGSLDDTTITGVQNTFDFEGDDNGKVLLIYNESDDQWETMQMECPA